MKTKPKVVISITFVNSEAKRAVELYEKHRDRLTHKQIYLKGIDKLEEK